MSTSVVDLTPGGYAGIVDEEEDGIPFAEKMEKLSVELFHKMWRNCPHFMEQEFIVRLEAEPVEPKLLRIPGIPFATIITVLKKVYLKK